VEPNAGVEKAPNAGAEEAQNAGVDEAPNAGDEPKIVLPNAGCVC
jgi:hypothetical protein